jgi:hypothetical protein
VHVLTDYYLPWGSYSMHSTVQHTAQHGGWYLKSAFPIPMMMTLMGCRDASTSAACCDTALRGRNAAVRSQYTAGFFVGYVVS